MKISVKIISLLLTLSLNISASGQVTSDSLVNANIDSLLISEADTVISFKNSTSGTIPIFNEIDVDSKRGSIFDSSYILYFRGLQWTIIKYFTFYPNNSYQPITLRSEPVHLLQDSTLLLLRKILRYISKEQFLPYIFEFETNGVKGYVMEYANHFPSYSITVSAKDYFDSKFIEEFTLDKKFPTLGSIPNDIPSNVNYKYNTSLNLFQFFKTLKKYIEKEDTHLKLKK